MFSQTIKEIDGFDGYFVSDNGVVYSTKKNGGYPTEMYEMALRTDKDGYLEVGLYKEKKRYFRRVHRLVGDAFIPNPEHLPQINHKDGNVQNNDVSNLEWCTCTDNLIHSFRVLKREASITTAKSIKLTDKETGEVKFFKTEKDCAYFLHMSHEHLNRLLTGKSDINKWKKRNKYSVEFCGVEGVTTIPKGSTQ